MRLRAPFIRAVTLLLVLGVAASCETGILTPNLGAMLRGTSEVALIVYVCAADDVFDLGIELDPDRQPLSGDESVWWQIRGRARTRGVMEVEVGSVPSGFEEITPLARALDPGTRYGAFLRWDRLDQGIEFLPSKLPREGISRAGRVVTRDTFREDAVAACG